MLYLQTGQQCAETLSGLVNQCLPFTGYTHTHTHNNECEECTTPPCLPRSLTSCNTAAVATCRLPLLPSAVGSSNNTLMASRWPSTRASSWYLHAIQPIIPRHKTSLPVYHPNSTCRQRFSSFSMVCSYQHLENYAQYQAPSCGNACKKGGAILIPDIAIRLCGSGAVSQQSERNCACMN